MDKDISFQLSSKVDVGGCSLQDYLPGVKHAQLVKAFGNPIEIGYADEEKGYDGQEWFFEASNGEVFTVYSRWGEYRIGGRAPLLFDEPRGTADFKDWVLAMINKGKVTA